jgi:hypothetical protein
MFYIYSRTNQYFSLYETGFYNRDELFAVRYDLVLQIKQFIFRLSRVKHRTTVPHFYITNIHPTISRCAAAAARAAAAAAAGGGR